jgi:thiol-disulfide isomerase/thioredoxin
MDSMLERRLGSTLLLLGALALSACATPSADSPAAQDSPATSAPSMSSSATPDPAETPSGQATPSEEPPPAAPTAGAYVDYADGIVEQTAGAKVLFFHAPWCPQCRKLDEELLSAGAPDGLTVFKVDYDSRSDLRQRYGVTLQTTVVFVDDTGAPIASTVLYEDPSIASLLAAAP